ILSKSTPILASKTQTQLSLEDPSIPSTVLGTGMLRAGRRPKTQDGSYYEHYPLSANVGGKSSGWLSTFPTGWKIY
ncbi:MAG TPA: hypothetical protein VMW23_01515, partial [Sedimentisphaerales bacterium]|nr:hypothetical protein [Sedimentisphaerales bacterium]